jgi:hypothetical protein
MNPRDHTLAIYRATCALLIAAWFVSLTAIGERQYRRAYLEQVAVMHPAGGSP